MSTLDRVDNHYTESLTSAGFELRRGWSDEIASELVTLSHQAHIMQMTPNDAQKRFQSVEAAHEWHDAHDRTVYTLSRHAVAGLIWFGESQTDYAPGNYTFAIRMYSEAQGQGLARPFMNAAHADFRESTYYTDEIWLDTAATNDTAIALYHKMGYVDVHTARERIYMTNLPSRK